MGAASKASKIAACGKCGQSRRQWQQMKGGLSICRECFENTIDRENAELRREVHELKAVIARMKRDGFAEDGRELIRGLRPSMPITPPEQRWNGYSQ